MGGSDLPRSRTRLRVNQATKDRLGRVARIYRNAGRDGLPPTKTVADKLGISRNAAAALVARARRAGLLPATTTRRATRPTHSPISATTTDGQTLLVCRTCLTTWRCPAWRDS